MQCYSHGPAVYVNQRRVTEQLSANANVLSVGLKHHKMIQRLLQAEQQLSLLFFLRCTA